MNSAVKLDKRTMDLKTLMMLDAHYRALVTQNLIELAYMKDYPQLDAYVQAANSRIQVFVTADGEVIQQIERNNREE